MRFDLEESIAAMKRGDKTQTRRRSPYWLNKKPGDRITIVHKGEYLGYATVVRTWEHALGSTTEGEARAEGYDGWHTFSAVWWGMHPDAIALDTVYAIEFKDIRWK